MRLTVVYLFNSVNTLKHRGENKEGQMPWIKMENCVACGGCILIVKVGNVCPL